MNNVCGFYQLRTALHDRNIPATMAYLKREAKDGGIPCEKIGRRFVFNVDAVASVIERRAAGPYLEALMKTKKKDLPGTPGSALRELCATVAPIVEIIGDPVESIGARAAEIRNTGKRAIQELNELMEGANERLHAKSREWNAAYAVDRVRADPRAEKAMEAIKRDQAQLRSAQWLVQNLLDLVVKLEALRLITKGLRADLEGGAKCL